jgi:uncharacterized membrane protein YagU involved in acid resistance
MSALTVFMIVGLLAVLIGGFVSTRLEIPLWLRREESEHEQQAKMRKLLGLDTDGEDESDRYWQRD